MNSGQRRCWKSVITRTHTEGMVGTSCTSFGEYTSAEAHAWIEAGDEAITCPPARLKLLGEGKEKGTLQVITLGNPSHSGFV